MPDIESPEERAAVTAFVEPWQPSVGQRVRIRISPECQYCEGDKTDGSTGTVVDTRHTEASAIRNVEADYQAHHIWVSVDRLGWNHYAAIELEPIDDVL